MSPPQRDQNVQFNREGFEDNFDLEKAQMFSDINNIEQISLFGPVRRELGFATQDPSPEENLFEDGEGIEGVEGVEAMEGAESIEEIPEALKSTKVKDMLN
mmetsp:Transcript_5168/g.7967  ORF Transcript_5168/g.7967 Transcript_5168/m.7967 type:complete len:101 (+) Transcript_5168:2168-2470(+)